MKILLVGVELFHADGQRDRRTDGREGGPKDGQTKDSRTDRQTDMTKLT
jgi:hypothetical protein